MRIAAVVLASLFVLGACSDDDSTGATPGNGNGNGTDPPVDAASCTSGCADKASACGAGASADLCDAICGSGLTASQLACLQSTDCEELARTEDFAELCPPKPSGGTTDPPATSGGAEGDACTCGESGSSYAECTGTDVCSPGLTCVSNSPPTGTCRARCCSSKAECADALGKQGDCSDGLTCDGCLGGIECVGDTCTCIGGTVPSVGYCQ